MAKNFTASDKVPWRCEQGHEWLAQYNNVRNGSWCPRCRNKSEAMCYLVATTLFPGFAFRRNVRDLSWLGTGQKGNPLELDIWCEELELAVEFNGFLHDGPVTAYGGDDHYAKIRAHDETKANACFDRGVNLLVVRFSEVSVNQRQCDLGLIAEKIWNFVIDVRYPAGTHLGSFAELLEALGLDQ